MRNILIALSFIFFLASCSKYNVQYEGATPLNNQSEIVPTTEPIVLMTAYKIILTNVKFNNFKDLVTTTNSNQMQCMALNGNQDRIAYKLFNDDIKIIDTNGVLQATVQNSSLVRAFEFNTQGTLYMINDAGNITYYGGPAMEFTNMNSYVQNLGTVYGLVIFPGSRFVCFYEDANSKQDRMYFRKAPGNVVDVPIPDCDRALLARVYPPKEADFDYNIYFRTLSSSGFRSYYFEVNGLNNVLSSVQNTSEDIYVEKPYAPYAKLEYEEDFHFYYSSAAENFEWKNMHTNIQVLNVDF